MQTRNQEIAVDVFGRVQRQEMGENKTQYGSMAHKLPIMIRTAGLAQALSFIQAKSISGSNSGLSTLLNDLAETLGYQDGKKLVLSCQNAQLSEYIYLTNRCLAALIWYKRFAESVLKVDAGESGD